MKFVCDRCQTKYSIADDKVRGKVLKVRCKTCQNVITVREPGARPSVGSLAPVRPPSSDAIAALGPGAEDELSERTQLAQVPAGFMAEIAQQQRRPTPPPPPPIGDGIEWFLALEGAQQGPFSQKELVDKLLAMAKDADVHVWNEQMDGWKAPRDVPPVAKAMAARVAPPPPVPVKPPVPRTTPSPPVPPVGARRPTMPLTSGLGPKLPIPGASAPLAARAHAPAGGPSAHGGEATAIPTPGLPRSPSAPHAVPVPAPHAHGTNGANGAHAATHTTNGLAHATAAKAATDTDALAALNLGGGAVAAKPAAAPRIMDPVAATAWEGAQPQAGRNRGTKLAVAFLGVIGVIVAVVMMSMTKKPPPVVTAPAPKPAFDPEAVGKLAETVAHEKPTPTPATTGSSTAPTAAVEPPSRGS
ncbi:MAG TPA: zinc-ribbon domain-containing protein, partial [Polyangia bacterium]|nr:zinc-ribbon domain-containing protein [Polyangia bacterium]